MKETGLSRVSKNLIIKEVEKEAEKRPSFFVSQHGLGLPAASLDKLRAKLRGANARYLMVKNSLGRIALDRQGMKDVPLSGASGIAFIGGDAAASSKILVDFGKENEAFKIQCGYLDGRVLTQADVKALASLPSKEVLLARVVGGIQTPISRFVSVLSGTVRQVVNVLDAIAKKKGTSAPAQESTPKQSESEGEVK